MDMKIFVAVALALWGATAVGQAAMGTEDQLIRSAFFSDACRHEAEELGIAHTSDANALVVAFGRQRDSTPSADRPDARHDECKAPVVLLINLLRLNGLDAELAFISMTPAATAADGAPGDKIDRVLVYVPALDRYVDPAAPLGKQAVLDQIIAESARRSHLLGPSLANDVRGSCLDTCLQVYSPRGESSVRVKTEVIRGR